MTDAQAMLSTVRAQIEAARSAAAKATNPKEARRLRVVASSLEKALRKIERQQIYGDPSEP
ncbi:MAG: hypothetical protein V4517_16470 [Pseudomonadota bacterium]|jgi:hypothetical protein